jgi:Leucine Rich repeat
MRKVMLVLVVGFGLLLGSLQQSRADEPQAIAEIEKLGGSVRKIAANVESKEVAFHLSGTSLDDQGIALVPQIAQVIWLNLRGTKITDAGLAHLAGMKDLQRLHLEKTTIGDAGLKHLLGLENLEYLNLYGTQVTDSGIMQLGSLKKLKKLYVWQSQVTPEGVKRLKEVLTGAEIVLNVELAKPHPTVQPPLPELPATEAK